VLHRAGAARRRELCGGRRAAEAAAAARRCLPATAICTCWSCRAYCRWHLPLAGSRLQARCRGQREEKAASLHRPPLADDVAHAGGAAGADALGSTPCQGWRPAAQVSCRLATGARMMERTRAVVGPDAAAAGASSLSSTVLVEQSNRGQEGQWGASAATARLYTPQTPACLIE
jgi:hypothetical protein